MFYTIYKTTNKVNQKFYIGKHQTVDINDDYLGSGVLLKEAILKYGKENFQKEILFVFNTIDEMNTCEKELVTENLVKDPMCYNIGLGGEGGPHFKGKRHTSDTRKRISDSRVNKSASNQTKKKMSENHWSKKDPIAQKEHARKIASAPKSESHKRSLSRAAKKNKFGKVNKGKVRTKIKCPYCEVHGASNTMYRWHFDNCKKKIIAASDSLTAGS